MFLADSLTPYKIDLKISSTGALPHEFDISNDPFTKCGDAIHFHFWHRHVVIRGIFRNVDRKLREFHPIASEAVVNPLVPRLFACFSCRNSVLQI